MSAPDQRHSGDAPAASLNAIPDFNASIASLRAAGADRFDPIGLHYLEALARRASAQEGSVRRLLDARLAQALATFRERFALAQADAVDMLEQSLQQYPQAAGELKRLHAAGDFKGMRKLVLDLKTPQPTASLGTLVRRLEQHSPDDAEGGVRKHAAMRPELKTIRSFQKTLARLSVHKQVAQAIEQAPKNAGPINSHMLVLRSLALMRDISPDYLNRFISYADTLLCLDQGEKDRLAPAKKSQAAKTAKK
ncbi:DUF2894 domain-containing protein [Noviherbaspirillum aerium]|uniref:DUF2894 domain-containing protein n=1 Tax=Noviherbaspirillum aerium TaxID=2588497 RepID=UPI00124CFA17|nr:DUF2894 domain-containing protein [Noviherbaspirillum aerium]